MKVTAIALLLASVSSAMAAPFTMICRGGGAMKIDLYSTTTTAKGKLVKSAGVGLNLHARKAPKGRSIENLRPGECRWHHRHIYPNEVFPIAGVLSDKFPKAHCTRFGKWIPCGSITRSYAGTGNGGTFKLIKKEDSYFRRMIWNRLYTHIRRDKIFSMVVAQRKGLLYIESISPR